MLGTFFRAAAWAEAFLGAADLLPSLLEELSGSRGPYPTGAATLIIDELDE